MNMFAPFEPERLIQEVKCVKTTGRNLTEKETKVLKEKLYIAENNHDIIRLARGDGRLQILDQIIADDRVVFGWGLKSQHAFHRQSKFRDFLEPNRVDIDQLKKVIKTFEKNLDYHYRKAEFSNVGANAQHHDMSQKLYALIEENQESQRKLLLIKDWICSVLHTSGCLDFQNTSPWVSASAGNDRYKTAYLFGAGKTSHYIGLKNCSRFVIFDTWVSAWDEHRTFERTQFLIESLEEMGLPWYPDRHHEIMLKYAIYPQNLIGYYYFEDNVLLYYYLNPNYLNHIKSDTDFHIGDDVYIDQTDVSFPADNPYRIIYRRGNGQFDVYERR